MFRDVTSSSGLSVQGESWGAAWGDANQDGFPDVYLSRHLGPGLLYVNQGDGRFREETQTYFGQFTQGDKHGAAWADFDNDGDQDLLQLRGGRQTTQLFQNDGQGFFTDIASSVGLDYPGSGRTPLWFDSNFDGRLDVVVNTRNRDEVPPTVFQQGPNGFQNVGVQTGFTPDNQLNKFYSLLTEVGGSRALDLLTRQASSLLGVEAFELGSLPYNPLTLPTGLVSVSAVGDIVSGDFDGDLHTDLFFARGGRRSDVFQPNPTRLNTFLKVDAGAQSVRFKSTGSLTLEFPTLSPDEIFIGGENINPVDNQFVISSSDSAAYGRPDYQEGSDRGIFLSYSSSAQEWTLTWSNPRANESIYTFVNSEQAIESVKTQGFRPDQQFLTDQLFLRRNQTFVNATQRAGFIPGQTAAVNAAAGDFDNDMDLDLYVVSTGSAGNRNNVIYENQGDAHFVMRQGAGFRGTARGLGDTVTTVDYDQDGFLDLFLTNGNLFDGLGQVSRLYYNDAPFEILKNQGNDNHWLQLNLNGVNSNRDGIGSQVYLTAGGVTQLREQSSGMHSHAQNHQRLHFGLAQSRRVSLLEVNWVNGLQHKIRGLIANQILTVEEGIGFAQRDVMIGTQANEAFQGFGGNDNLNARGGDDRLFGGNGQDQLRGGSGSDWLAGGGGNDWIKTGTGSDIVQFGRIGEGVDQIIDFVPERDRFELVIRGFEQAIDLGRLQAQQFTLGTAAQTNQHRIIYSTDTGDLWFDVDGVGTQSKVLIAQLSNRAALSASSFTGV